MVIYSKCPIEQKSIRIQVLSEYSVEVLKWYLYLLE